MIEVGVASPSAQGQAMISTATVLRSARLKAGAGPRSSQATNVSGREDQHGGDEPAGHAIGEALDRGARALRVAHHPDDPRQDRLRADASGAERERPGAIERAADHEVLSGLCHRHALAGEHALVDRRGAVDDDAIDGDGLARPDPDDVAGPNGGDVDVGIGSAAHDPGGSWCKPQQPADGVGGVAPRPRLQVPTEQDERDDHGGGVEVQRQRAVCRLQSRGPEEAGRPGSSPARSRTPPWSRRR